MKIEIIIWILFVHWKADFLFQSHEMSINKSKSNWWLSYHVLVYSIITTIGWCLLSIKSFNILTLFVFPITFITHWVTDYFTSRYSSKLYVRGDIHNFFVTIGFDQWIHYSTLLLTYKLLFNE